jgi:hypothetical protein
LRLVARYADACNLFAGDVSEVARKLDVLTRHCETEGRDPADIEKTIIAGWGNPLDDVDGFVSNMEKYAELGIEKVWLSPSGPDPAGWVTQITEQVLPKLAEL